MLKIEWNLKKHSRGISKGGEGETTRGLQEAQRQGAENKKIVREHYQQFYVNKFENLDETVENLEK